MKREHVQIQLAFSVDRSFRRREKVAMALLFFALVLARVGAVVSCVIPFTHFSLVSVSLGGTGREGVKGGD